MGILKRSYGFILLSACLAVTAWAGVLQAQSVVSPGVLAAGQPDTRDLGRLARDIYRNAGAVTERQKAEALWRFLLTDGRFVEPGQFYHIAGWAYEEPKGEALDPLKLLNSYGFGLCYQDGPLLEALFEAGGFVDARSWFLTGHTVCEVFYDGAYHMFDSDMLGFSTLNDGGDPRTSPVASVRQLEEDESIIMGKLKAPDMIDSGKVVLPWYPADVRARAMDGYARTFSSRGDNYLYPFQRYSSGHTMDYELRPGEKLTLFYEPECKGLYYLPYKHVRGEYIEFPREIEEYDILTEDGPHSQKDGRRWGTGRFEYLPQLSKRKSYYPLVGPEFNQNLRLPSGPGEALTRDRGDLPSQAVFEVASPWVLIDAEVSVYAQLETVAHHLLVEVSTDRGRNWRACGGICGPYFGPWKTGADVITVSRHGRLTAVSGTYGYLVRLTLSGPQPASAAGVGEVVIASLVQANPRNFPAITAGRNEMVYSPGPQRRRWSLPVRLEAFESYAARSRKMEYVLEHDNQLLKPKNWGGAEAVFAVAAPDSAEMVEFMAGGRFLALDSLAPEKLTAETRRTRLHAPHPSRARASIEWSRSLDGPWTEIWRYQPFTAGLDGEKIERLLSWPETDIKVNPGSGVRKVYVRYRLEGMALDDIRLAAFTAAGRTGGLILTHEWLSNGNRVTRTVDVPDPSREFRYSLDTGRGEFKNISISFECPAQE